MGQGPPTFETVGDAVLARVEGTVVGPVTWHADPEGAWHLGLGVDPAWRRRGIGSRLPLVLGTGLRGRIRMGSDDLTVRIPVQQLASVH